MLGIDGAEGEARRGLRRRAVKKVLASIDREESLSSLSVRVTWGLVLASLFLMGVSSLIYVIFIWTGETTTVALPMLASYGLVALSALGHVSAVRIRARRLSFRRRMDDAASHHDEEHEAEKPEAEEEPDHESSDENL